MKVSKKEHLESSKLKCEITKDVREARCIQPELVLRTVQRRTFLNTTCKSGELLDMLTDHELFKKGSAPSATEIRNFVIISLIPYHTKRCHYNRVLTFWSRNFTFKF